jgi:hypothetical protein
MLINKYKESSQRDALKEILSNYFDLYDLMIGTNHIKAYDDILKLIRCDKLTNWVISNKLV